ncbi:unnamed protein product [Vitrella brassicaformis CCMP3155]|uniref:Programmed cell death protein 2 C-terminal domain-containing protein n=1 Tax=Vitrella brassicaformis (strain CCMP3155) TaxID=1169540 RepID=A0A0G4F3V5_VITBC|nr:unnamed protein product [Vitrella brassicaformis CCMP3155]|eukprot:CEM06605.1 unnamed protein product [Vitrella brassicaformis CCMP3155]
MTTKKSSTSGDVLLGFVGPPLSASEATDPSVSRIGGKPAWLGEAPLESSLRCGICVGDLTFVAQMDTTYESSHHRVLYLFTCLHHLDTAASAAFPKPCCLYTQGWKAIRVKRTAALQATTPPVEERKTDPPGSGGTTGSASENVAADIVSYDDWGANVDDELEALIDKVTNWQPSAASTTQEKQQTAASQASASAAHATPTDEPTSSLPVYGYSLSVDEEPYHPGDQGAKSPEEESDEDELEDDDKAAASDAHVMQLYKRYCNDSSQQPPPPPPQQASKTADTKRPERRGSTSSFDDNEGNERDGSEVMGEEPYEADDPDVRALRAFQLRVARSPQQVVRYSFGGTPLWLKARDKEPGGGDGERCGACGGRRVFEMQLLPTLLTQLQSRLGHLLAEERKREAGGDGGETAEGVRSCMWDLSRVASGEWGTVVVMSCEADCGGDGDGRVEEGVVVQEEA